MELAYVGEFLSFATRLVSKVTIVMFGDFASTTDASRIYFIPQVPRMSELTT